MQRQSRFIHERVSEANERVYIVDAHEIGGESGKMSSPVYNIEGSSRKMKYFFCFFIFFCVDNLKIKSLLQLFVSPLGPLQTQRFLAGSDSRFLTSRQFGLSCQCLTNTMLTGPPFFKLSPGNSKSHRTSSIWLQKALF